VPGGVARREQIAPSIRACRTSSPADPRLDFLDVYRLIGLRHGSYASIAPGLSAHLRPAGGNPTAPTQVRLEY
jgi:hypothetical protein